MTARCPGARVDRLGPRRGSQWSIRLIALLLLTPIALPTGCAGKPGMADIQSPDATQRVLAIRAAGESRDTAAVPLLVDRLEDEDEGVRFYAILALERITGQRLGYDYGGSLIERAAAVERWRAYVRAGHDAQDSSRSAGGDSSTADAGGRSASTP